MHVLYVDDYEAMGELVAGLLEESGFAVTVMADAREALACCLGEGSEIDVAVVDLNMPGMDGDDLARKLAGANGPGVVIVSGHVDDACRQRALASGARAVLNKKDMLRELPGLLRDLFPNA